MSAERCNKCRFYKSTGDKGNCRRYPPAVLPLTDFMMEFKQSHPLVFQDGWCGEFSYKDKFIDLVANHKPGTNVIASDFTVSTESFDPTL